MLVSSQPRSDGAATLRLEGPLRAPVDPELRSRVLRLLRSGERRIVLDLAGVSRIDAAGVGELIRAYRMAIAVNGACRVVHATAWVREVLERVGLFALLAQGDDLADTEAACRAIPRVRFQSAGGTRTCYGSPLPQEDSAHVHRG